MDLVKMSLVFRVLIIILVYGIIYYALRIMYRDIKGQNGRRIKKTLGLEVVYAGENENLKVGGIIPINNTLFIGRGEENTLILNEKYASIKHAVIDQKNNEYYIEDLNSTNGTEVNNEIINKRRFLKKGDEIKIGSAYFKVIN